LQTSSALQANCASTHTTPKALRINNHTLAQYVAVNNDSNRYASGGRRPFPPDLLLVIMLEGYRVRQNTSFGSLSMVVMSVWGSDSRGEDIPFPVVFLRLSLKSRRGKRRRYLQLGGMRICI